METGSSKQEKTVIVVESNLAEITLAAIPQLAGIETAQCATTPVSHAALTASLLRRIQSAEQARVFVMWRKFAPASQVLAPQMNTYPTDRAVETAVD